MRTFFAITNTEDGAVIWGPFNEEELNDCLTEMSGSKTFRTPPFDQPEWVERWQENEYLIIEGKVVQPRPARTVVTYKVD